MLKWSTLLKSSLKQVNQIEQSLENNNKFNAEQSDKNAK